MRGSAQKTIRLTQKTKLRGVEEVPKYRFNTTWSKRRLNLAVRQVTKKYRIISNSQQDVNWQLRHVLPEVVILVEIVVLELLGITMVPLSKAMIPNLHMCKSI